ncbi:hypothetical protein [Amycolatopsis dendrobii]|uniref:Uncharacterized protein n=1 Tax=Amycolatopsis dendrobii TaxID=2760662 RepID=A0A7W3ZA10_9PSEU|nr:hypothetical protein [Amycolatopsis dendrobii]MBB1153971.1 hypothetical protein [Amycolatopsis dendrobii]
MRYDVQKLREAVKTAIANERAELETRHAQRITNYTELSNQWFDKHAEAWRQFGTLIGRRIRAGKPITPKDIPVDRKGYGRFATFDETEPGKFVGGPSSDLRIMSAALDLITDDTVSPSELAKLGVRASELRTVLLLARTDA